MKKDNKKEKVNPLIKEQKTVKNIKIRETSAGEDENVVKKLVIITIVIAVVIIVIYAVTELIKKDPEPATDAVAGSINYDIVSVGTILNRPYDEYYVLVYDSLDENAVLYSTILTKYMQDTEDKDNLKIYFCDLNNKLNSGYYNVGNDNVSNPKATKVDEFDFSDLTLLKVNNGKINKYIEDLEKIKETLK